MKKSVVILSLGMVLSVGLAAGIVSKASNVLEVHADGPWNVYVENELPARSVGRTHRYWFTSNAIWDSNPLLGIDILGGTFNDRQFLCTKVENGYDDDAQDDTVYYFDVPADATKFILLRLNPVATEVNSGGSNYNVWTQSHDIDMSDTAWVNHAAMHYITFENDKLRVSISDGYYHAKAGLLKEVLSDFPTCTATSSEVSMLYGQFMAHKESDDLSAITLDADFDRAEYKVNDSYDGLSPKSSVKPTVQEKWEALCEHAGINKDSGEPLAANTVASYGKNDSIVLFSAIGGITVVAGIALAVSYVRKKKESN